MNKCEKCGNKIPKIVEVEGVRKAVSNHRRFCFSCSPFGEHNTKKLNDVRYSQNTNIKICPKCGKEHNKRRFLCQNCVFNKKIDKTNEKVNNLVGKECWICGYNKASRSLCFHHVYPEDKKTSLTIREIAGLSWSNMIYPELQKCVHICMNCHGEIHEGMINEQTIVDLWKKKWSEILQKEV